MDRFARAEGAKRRAAGLFCPLIFFARGGHKKWVSEPRPSARITFQTGSGDMRRAAAAIKANPRPKKAGIA